MLLRKIRDKEQERSEPLRSCSLSAYSRKPTAYIYLIKRAKVPDVQNQMT